MFVYPFVLFISFYDELHYIVLRLYYYSILCRHLLFYIDLRYLMLFYIVLRLIDTIFCINV